MSVCGQTNDIEALGQLQVATLWGLNSDLWIMGGICALVCSVCFFARS